VESCRCRLLVCCLNGCCSWGWWFISAHTIFVGEWI
jgi:hypothetical protein